MTQNIRTELKSIIKPHKIKSTILVIIFLFIGSYAAISLPIPVYAENATCEDISNEAKHRCLSQKAKSGDLESQYSLGMYYMNEGDCADGLKWLKKTALKNYSNAQYQLGNFYMGRIQYLPGNCGIKIDSNEAIEWYKKSADSGNSYACHELGSIYYESKDMRDNYKHAFHYLKLAAEAGDKQAALRLGIMYDQGQGVRRDFEESIKWFNVASEEGDPYYKKLLNAEILKNNLYKTLVVKPFKRLRELSFIEYIIALLLALIGIRLTIKYNREKLPFYSVRGFNLIQDFTSNVENLKVLYGRNKIDNLSITNLIFWNAGRETIHYSDMASDEPLRLICEGNVKFLNAKIIYSNNPSNKFQHVINEDKTMVQINFDYVDKNDGLILQVLHTNIDPYAIELLGRIKGAGRPKFKTISKSISSAKNLILNLIPFILLIALIIAYLLLQFFSEPAKFDFFYRDTLMFPLFIIILIMSLTLMTIRCIQFIRNRLPKGYKSFLEDKIN